MADNFEGIKNRRFGIEIEMTGITRCSAAKAIRDVLGGSVEHIGGSYDKYKIYDEDGRAWSIMSDASIEPYKKNGDRASDLYKVEMNSPVLDYEDIPLLQSVIRGLRSAGAITGPQYDCGTHQSVADGTEVSALKATRSRNAERLGAGVQGCSQYRSQ